MQGRLPTNKPRVAFSVHGGLGLRAAVLLAALPFVLLAAAPQGTTPKGTTTVSATTSLNGALRIARADSRAYFADDTGPRRVLFTSWFPALRIWRDSQPEAEAVLDQIAAAGYQ